VVLVRAGGLDRHAVLSHRKAREELGWRKLFEDFRAGRHVTGVVVKSVKGGFLVDFRGAGAFLPLAHAAPIPLKKGQSLVGEGVECVVLEMDPGKRRAVVSRRQVLEEEAAREKRRRLASILPGSVHEGRVVSLVEFGAFVDLDGVQGLIHLSDLSWRPVKHPREVVKKGQKVRVKVLKVMPEQMKLSLGLKQLQENPAETLRRRYRPGTKVTGSVTAVSARGAQVRIAEDVNGFVPASDFPQEKVSAKPGEELHAVVQGVEPRTFELLLSVKRYEEIEQRETVKKYLKGGPRLTLGDLLKPGQ